MARPGIDPKTSDLRVRCPTDCTVRPGSLPSGMFFSIVLKTSNDVQPRLVRAISHLSYPGRICSCTTAELSKLATSCLTTIKNHVIKYCEKVYERSGKNLLWSIKNSYEVTNNLNSRGFHASSLSTYEFLYYILPCPTILFRIN